MLAAQTEHFTGADLGGLIGTAHLAAVHSTLDPHIENGNEEGGPSPSVATAAHDELVGEVLVIGRRKKGGQGTSRAELGELRKRVGKMIGVGRKDLAGSIDGGLGSSEAPVCASGLFFIRCNRLLTFLCLPLDVRSPTSPRPSSRLPLRQHGHRSRSRNATGSNASTAPLSMNGRSMASRALRGEGQLLAAGAVSDDLASAKSDSEKRRELSDSAR